MTAPADNTPHRQGGLGRPWQKGVSGNPAGPGTGSRNRASLIQDRMADGEAEAVLQAVLKAAKAGDTTAAKLLLDRMWPARKGRAVTLDLPALTTAGDVTLALSATIAAMAEGTLSPEEASTVAGVLEVQRRAIETEALEARLAALEAAQPQGTHRR